ncbi:MAG: thiamine phosphate synthase [Flavobacteriales bacterium]|nr:thiamine phosphate synthase [Flavobacteriales bacterium]
MPRSISDFQYITNQEEPIELFETVTELVALGVDWIQLRAKNASEEERREMAFELRSICTIHNAKLIINDDVQLAKLAGADGVHLGKLDMDLKEARSILGDGFIIGATANTYEDVVRLDPYADYIGLGPLRRTKTKKQLSPILGFEGVRSVMKNYAIDGLETPVVVVGGVTSEDIVDLLRYNINGVAVSSFLGMTSDKKNVIEAFKSSLFQANKTKENGIIENS